MPIKKRGPEVDAAVINAAAILAVERLRQSFKCFEDKPSSTLADPSGFMCFDEIYSRINELIPDNL